MTATGDRCGGATMTIQFQTKKLKRALFARVLVGVVAAVVAAQPASAQKGDRFQRLDVNRDGVITLPDLLAVSDRRVKLMDTDGDGAVTRAEFMAFQEKRARKRVDRIFNRLDANRHGKISLAKATGRTKRRLTRADANGDGMVTRTELLEQLRRRAARWQGRIFTRFDRDRDGRISRDERVAATQVRFRRLDSNNDGNISRTEFDGALIRWRKRRQR